MTSTIVAESRIVDGGGRVTLAGPSMSAILLGEWHAPRGGSEAHRPHTSFGPAIAVGIVGDPFPRGRAHILEAPFRLPAEEILRLGRVRVHHGHVSRASWRNLVGDGLATRLLKGLDHVQHRVARAGAQVDDKGARLFSELAHRGHVPQGQVDDVDVVTHARAVVGGVVIPEDGELGPDASGHLLDEGHEVVGDALGVLAHESRGVGAHGVEVAQQGDVPLVVRLVHVLEDLLDEELCAPVGVGGRVWEGLVHRHGGRVTIHGGRGGEDYVLAAVAAHCLEQRNRPGDVVLVVEQGQLDGFAHRLEPGKVDDGVILVRGKHSLHRSLVHEVHLEKGHGLPGDLLNATQRLLSRVGKVIKRGDLEARVQQLHEGVAADVASASGDENAR
mmetsp:Transcript_1210/g.2838  ORF Transcript_1210/g.2838 Transcript_1210/m.2838 type:complete len:388 (+) Transcript_1210:157-1320(+)